MVLRRRSGLWRNMLSRIGMDVFKRSLTIFVVLTIFFFCCVSFAAENSGKYQVIAGSDDKAYLLDTSTGAVWVLTYRTLATGREPIAIPYKFIKISPKSEQEFLFESMTGGASMPPSETK
jgi:hypothetical protein